MCFSWYTIEIMTADARHAIVIRGSSDVFTRSTLEHLGMLLGVEAGYSELCTEIINNPLDTDKSTLAKMFRNRVQ
eukprot:gene18783-22438_t